MHYTTEQYRRMDSTLFSGCAERPAFLSLLKRYGQTLPAAHQEEFKIAVDIGSVSGFYLAAFTGFRMKAIGVNLDAEALRYLKEDAVYAPYVWYGDDIQLLEADMSELPLARGSIDLVTVMTGTFSHIERGKHDSVLEELARILRPGRPVIISDWNIVSEKQDFLGLYTREEQEILQKNHLGYPHLLTALPKFNFTHRLSCLHTDEKMYMVLATKS